MAKKETKSAVEKEYEKQQNRIKSYVRKYAEKGVIFSEDVLPNAPKKITEGSVRRLKQITPKKLMQKAFAIEPETGEVVQGEKALIEYAKVHHYSPQPVIKGDFASEIRQRNEAINADIQAKVQEAQQEYENKMLTDTPHKAYNNEFESQYDSPPSLNDKALRGVAEILDRAEGNVDKVGSLSDERSFRAGAVHRMLQNAINERGATAVAQAIENNASEFEDIVSNIIYKGYSDEVYTAEMTQLARLIKASPLTLQEAQEIGMQMDEDESEEDY